MYVDEPMSTTNIYIYVECTANVYSKPASSRIPTTSKKTPSH